jgi:POT family proton-dependent oligopeptide transporter
MSKQSPLQPATPSDDTAFFGHPRGLSTLFFTEMWERLSYYGMRAILILYMTAAPAAGGLGFGDKEGGLIYGIYTGSVYVLSLLGGWIADRFTGQRRAVLWGGIGIMIGHICLAVPATSTFYLGLVIIALGTGLLKPNISTIVGQLYAPEDDRRDAGFSIYYMGINIGAGVAPYVIGFLAQSETFRGWLGQAGIAPEVAWHFGFGAAAVGMFFGVVQYVAGGRRLRDAGLHPTPPRDAEEAARNRRYLLLFIGLLVGLPAVVAFLGKTGVVELTTDRVSYGTLVVLLLVAVGFFVAMFTVARWTPAERRRIVAILALFFGAAFFFSVFEQAGSTFNLFADRSTENSVFGWTFPSSYWQGVNSAFIILFAPLFAGIWTFLAHRHKNPSWPVKFALGLVLVAVGCLVMIPAAHTVEGGGKAGPSYLLMLYFFHTCAELCLSPVGLSSTTKVAPKQIAGLAMGVWFMGTGIGNYLSGMYAGWTESLPLPRLFLTMAIPPLVAGVIFFLLAPALRRASGDDAGSATPGAH